MKGVKMVAIFVSLLGAVIGLIFTAWMLDRQDEQREIIDKMRKGGM